MWTLVWNSGCRTRMVIYYCNLFPQSNRIISICSNWIWVLIWRLKEPHWLHLRTILIIRVVNTWYISSQFLSGSRVRSIYFETLVCQVNVIKGLMVNQILNLSLKFLNILQKTWDKLILTSAVTFYLASRNSFT